MVSGAWSVRQRGSGVRASLRRFVAWRGVRRGVAWRGVAWRGAAWRGVARRGAARRGVAWRGVASGGAQQAAVLEHHLHPAAEEPRARYGSVAEAMHLEQRVARADELHRGARPRVRQREDARACQVGAACHQNAH
jgi:hypothetical protein